MLLQVPFLWSATAVARSGSRTRRTYRETVGVEVREISAGDAVPVLTWRGAKPVSEGGGAPPVPVTAVAHGGGLYEPVRSLDHAPDGRGGRAWQVRTTGPSDLDAALSDPGKSGPRTGAPRVEAFFPGLRIVADAWQVRLAPPANGKFEDSYRERALAEVRKAAGRLLLVDGAVHRASPEPMLLAVPSKRAVWLHDFSAEIPFEERCRLYRLDEAGEAAAHVAEVAACSATDVDMPYFELLRPDLLARGSAVEAVRSAARLIHRAAALSFRSLDAEAIELYCDLDETRYGDADPAWLAGRVAALAPLVAAACPYRSAEVREALHVVGLRAPAPAPAAP